MSQIQQNQNSTQNMINPTQNINYQQIQIPNNETTISNTNKLNEDNSLTTSFYLRNFIQSNDITELSQFLKDNKLSKQNLSIGIFILLQKYEKSPIIYKMFDLLLFSGADVNAPIIYMNHRKIEENEKITLLMFAIMLNDIELIKIILKYHPDINKLDAKNRNAIVYSVLYDNNDNPDIISLLIEEKANIDSFIEEPINNLYEIHSIFTFACFKGLVNIVKVLLDNKVNVNYQTKLKGETGLHLAVQYQHIEIIKLLLNNNVVFVDQVDYNGKKPFDIAKEKGNKDIINLFNNYYNIRNIVGNNLSMNMSAPPVMNNSFLMNNNNNNFIHNENYEEEKGKDISSNHINNSINLLSQSQNLSINPQYQNNILMRDVPLQINNQTNNLYNNLNIKKEKKNILSLKDISELKNKFSTNIIKKKQNNNYNLQIPIEFIYNNIMINNNYTNQKEENSKLNNFIKISNTPTLTLDLTDKSIEMELRLNELKNQLKEKEEIIKKFENQMTEKKQTIESLSKKLNEKEKDLTELKSKNDYYKNQIENLQQKKNELILKIPNSSDLQNKNLSLKEYRDAKFLPAKYDEDLIIHILQKDLLDYQNYIQEQMSKKKYIIEQLIANIQMSINERIENIEVKIYGSYATGLSLPWSDIDIILINRNNNLKNQPETILRQLCYLFTGKKWINSMKFLENLPIPSIKIVSSSDYGSISIDITIQDDKHYGLKCVSLIESYLKEYNALRPIILALKTILKNANLNDPKSGGLSSYGLILMVVSYIQSKRDTNNYQDDDKDIIGKTFHGFLGHYGIYFDFNRYVILTYPIKDNNNIPIIGNDTLLNFDQSHDLIIVDPLNNKNNVAQKTFQFMNLKMAFMIAFMVTREDCECGCHYGKATYLHSINNIEHCILKRMFNSVKRFSDSK